MNYDVAVVKRKRFISEPMSYFASPPPAGGGTVLFDALGTSGHTGPATFFDHDGMTVGSGLTNGALIFILCNGGSSPISAVTATWDNLGGSPQSMFSIGIAAHGTAVANQVVLFGLRNPHAGNLRARFDWTGSSQVAVCGISFSGVIQSSDAAAFANFVANPGNGITADVTVTTGENHFVIAGYCTGPQNVLSVSDTPMFIDNAMSNNTTGGNCKAGAGSSVNLTAALNAGMDWVAGGFDLMPA